MLSDSDAEDEGTECAAQQQLASPAARAALTAYSVTLAPNRHKLPEDGANGGKQEAAIRNEQRGHDAAECSSSNQQQTPPVSWRRRSRKLSKQRSNAVVEPASDSDQQPAEVQGKYGSSMIRDPAKDIARAAARGRPGGVTLISDLSLVPLLRTSASGSGFRVTSFHPATASAGPVQYNALEPVEFAIDRPPWRRLRTGQSQRSVASSADRSQALPSDTYAEEMPFSAAEMPGSLGAPAVVAPILTTAQLDADSMEAARAITDYPWHYNFIPAARRAPSGTAGFAASSSVEQDRRRGLLQDAQHKKQGLSNNTFSKEAAQDQPLTSLPPLMNAGSSARMMMGYSRSLSGVALQRGLPSLEINGHPVSLSPDRPSSAARVTIG